MKTDAIIQQQVEKALHVNTLLNAAEIFVDVFNGSVTLTGFVDKYPKKELARKIAKGIEGVKSAMERISVKVNEGDRCSDSEIQQAITERFIKNFGNSHNDIKITVNNGEVGLEGRLKWKYQKDLAEECIINLKGITSIKNSITIPEKPQAVIDEKDVFAAIYGEPSITTDIIIEIIGNRVILKGKVHNTEQKNLVASLVRNVQGVQEIENFLTMDKVS